MSSIRLGRTAAAALSTTAVGGGFLFLVTNNKEDEEQQAASEALTKIQPSSWMTLSVAARETLLPMVVRCEEGISSSSTCTTGDLSYPDLTRFGKRSYLKRHLTPQVYSQLKDVKTAAGVTLEDLISSGVSLPWGARPPRGCGIYAGDEESYQVFAPLLVPVLEDYHHFRMTPRAKKNALKKPNNNPITKTPRGRPNPMLRRQVTNLNPGYVLQQKLDPEGQYILHTRMRVARSISGFAFSPAIDRAKRRELEQLFQECVKDWKDDPDLGGSYLRVMDMNNEQHKDLIQRHILFHDPDQYSLTAGLGREWPDARGIFLNSPEDPELMIWLNAEDHLRVISMSKGGDLLGVFTRLSKAVTALETSLQNRGYNFCTDPRLGFLNTSPENLGTALRSSVFVKLPRLGQQPGFDDLLDRLRLEASSRFQGENMTGIFDIANAERLGQSEVQLINTMINGVGRLITLEKKLENGEKVDLQEIV